MTQILVLEDSPSLNRMIVLMLETEGYSVAAALGCNEALDKLTVDTELLLLDLHMPGLDGATCLTGMLERGFEGKVVFVSGATDGPLLAEATGADGYLAKPFAPEDLIAMVAKQLQRHGTRV